MIDSYAVSNESFAEFVAATEYVTEAERFGWSFVFGGLLPDDFPATRAVAAAPWWRQVYEVDWRRPEGPQSDISERPDHPVVHVSFNDALNYCAWAGKRLMNVWQGRFPSENTLDDGYYGTCSVHAFEPNGYGIYNMTGNVWEWTADWFHPTFRAQDHRIDPVGPPTGTHKVQKGGSH